MPPQHPAASAPLVPARSRVSGTSVGMFAIVLLIWLLSLVVVALPAYGVAVLAGWPRVTVVILACAAWTASAALILVRPVEAGLARLLYREPAPAAAGRAGPDRPGAGAGVPPGRDRPAAATCSGSRRSGRSTRSRSAATCWP